MQLQPSPAPFALRSYSTGSSPPVGPSSSGQPSGASPVGYGQRPILTWQPSALASVDTLWLFSEEGCMWASCIIQWLEALRSVIAWRLYAAAMYAVPQLADKAPENID